MANCISDAAHHAGITQSLPAAAPTDAPGLIVWKDKGSVGEVQEQHQQVPAAVRQAPRGDEWQAQHGAAVEEGLETAHATWPYVKQQMALHGHTDAS